MSGGDASATPAPRKPDVNVPTQEGLALWTDCGVLPRVALFSLTANRHEPVAGRLPGRPNEC